MEKPVGHVTANVPNEAVLSQRELLNRRNRRKRKSNSAYGIPCIATSGRSSTNQSSKTTVNIKSRCDEAAPDREHSKMLVTYLGQASLLTYLLAQQASEQLPLVQQLNHLPPPLRPLRLHPTGSGCQYWLAVLNPRSPLVASRKPTRLLPTIWWAIQKRLPLL